ncbi:MAG TPA: formyltransferase, partial [Candidatus Dormibacteraeota bacterium]|nr:formyltransferase [Candidatus Dormibacteraeota bacterium]
VVMAYHDIGYVCLDELLSLGADVGAVVTHRDQPGRELIWFRSVADRARRAGVPVLEPESVNAPSVVRELARIAPEMILSFYFRDVLEPAVLRLAPRGALNLHGSLLPRYRGRCPINWVLIHGERETGVTLHHMEARPDTGDIVAQRAVPIADEDTALSLNQKLGEAARALLRETFPRLEAGTAPRIPQDRSRASYFGGRRPEDGRLAWRRTARQLGDLVRAVTYPYPGAFTTWRGQQLYVWRARPLAQAASGAPGEVFAFDADESPLVATGDGALVLTEVQVAAHERERGDEFVRRVGLRRGERLGGGEPC